MGAPESGPVVIEDPKGARALTDLGLLPLLVLFLRGEASVGEAAKCLDTGFDRVYYQVRKLEALGILRVVRSETRSGRAIKYYRAAADAFFVPFTVLPHETFERAVTEGARVPEEMRAASTARALLEQVDDPDHWGFRVNVEPGGTVNAFWGPRDAASDWSVLDYLLEPERPAVYGTNTSLSLTREQAKELQRELHELMARWSARSRRNRVEGAGGPLHDTLVGVGMAPDAGDRR